MSNLNSFLPKQSFVEGSTTSTNFVGTDAVAATFLTNEGSNIPVVTIDGDIVYIKCTATTTWNGSSIGGGSNEVKAILPETGLRFGQRVWVRSAPTFDGDNRIWLLYKNEPGTQYDFARYGGEVLWPGNGSVGHSVDPMHPLEFVWINDCWRKIT